MALIVLLVVVLVLCLFFVFAILHTLIGLLLFLVLAGLCAAAAEYFLGQKEGVGETVLIGLIGAAVGVVLARILHLPLLLSPFGVPVIWTILGSMLVVLVLRLAMGRRGGRFI